MACYSISARLQINEDGDTATILTAAARIAQVTQEYFLGQELHSLLSTRLWVRAPTLSQRQVSVASAPAGHRGLCGPSGLSSEFSTLQGRLCRHEQMLSASVLLVNLLLATLPMPWVYDVILI